MSHLSSFAEGKWSTTNTNLREVLNAVTGEKVADISSDGLNFKAMLDYARTVGNPRLRAMTFHERGRMLKKLAQYLMEHKDSLYEVSRATGATKVDSWIDIEGGIGTLFTAASKGRRELPDTPFLVDGNQEQISKEGTFTATHICTPLMGVAVHINAFNFPCWGMLEKLSMNFLAGMPAIVKPASATAYLTQAMVSKMLESEILPEGALQLICGGVGDLLDHLDCQDVVTFTGSADTGNKLRSHPNIIENSVRFNMEADSLNCSILGADINPDQPEFDLFIKEVAREMTVKAGQKCTAIRRIMVPESQVSEVMEALKARLSKISVGDPAQEGIKMGPLVSDAQVKDVREKVALLQKEAEVVFGDPVGGNGTSKGSFFSPVLLYCKNPGQASAPHDIEAFGPVATILPYKETKDVIELANRGKGSLVGSLFTFDDQLATEVVLGIAPFHGRLMVINRECAKESTGHGSPLPHLVHGGPGRAGGGEEMGGVRGVMIYLQRTALQGSPTTLSKICKRYFKGATPTHDRIHPFRKTFHEIEIGEQLVTHRRTVTEADIVQFAGISGDFFYAHTDEIAAKESFFEQRVAHGYFVLSAAAGLFVDPAPGPVIANYGLEKLRFVEPVHIGDSIYVKFTCKQKTEKEPREDLPPHGVVEWDVEVLNQEDVVVAMYEILTLVKA